MPEQLFGSVELAARIERAETNLLRGCVEAATRQGSTRAVSMPIAGGLATWADHGSPVNKVAGLGFGGELDLAELERVERAFAERDTAVQVELSDLGDTGIAAQLSRRGYLLVNFEHVLGRRLSAGATVADLPEVSIARCEKHQDALWLDVVVSGFAAPDTRGVPSHESFPREALERIMGGMTSEGGFRHYLAFRSGVPAGGGSMRIDEDGIVQLCGAATLPEHRRRGIQGALLATRLADAGNAGCGLAVVTTQPGSTSQQNVERQGFRLLYTRVVLVRESS